MLQGTNKHYLVKQNSQNVKYTVPYKSSMIAQQKKIRTWSYIVIAQYLHAKMGTYLVETNLSVQTMKTSIYATRS
jgi:hypothetical protein